MILIIPAFIIGWLIAMRLTPYSSFLPSRSPNVEAGIAPTVSPEVRPRPTWLRGPAAGIALFVATIIPPLLFGRIGMTMFVMYFACLIVYCATVGMQLSARTDAPSSQTTQHPSPTTLPRAASVLVVFAAATALLIPLHVLVAGVHWSFVAVDGATLAFLSLFTWFALRRTNMLHGALTPVAHTWRNIELITIALALCLVVATLELVLIASGAEKLWWIPSLFAVATLSASFAMFLRPWEIHARQQDTKPNE